MILIQVIVVETIIIIGDIPITGKESSSQPDINSGGVNKGSTSQHNITMNIKRIIKITIPRQTVWNRVQPNELIIGDPDVGVKARSTSQTQCNYLGFLSAIEPKEIEEVHGDPD